MRANIAAAQDLQSGDMRLDASYHASSGHQALRSLRGAGKRTDRLDQVCLPNGIFIPGRFRRVYVDNPQHGLRWLSPSDMQKADLSGLSYVSRKYTPDLDVLRIQKGWILLSRSGTIGNLVYVRDDMDGLIGSDDIIRIAPNPQTIFPGYLYALLSSPAMVEVIQQKTYGAVIPHIEAHHVVDLPIPRLDPSQEEEIHQLIEQAAVLRVEANICLTQAQETLDELIFGDDENLSTLSTHIQGGIRLGATHSNDVFLGDFRLDASYHVSLGQKALPYLLEKGRKLERLDQVCLPGGLFIPGRFKRIYVEDIHHGDPYLTGGFILKLKPLQGTKLLSHQQITNKDELVLREKMILITCSGIIGNIIYVNGNFRGSVGSPDLIRIVADNQKIQSGYLYAYLRSPLARLLIQQKTYGAVIPHIEAHHLFDLPVPRFDTDLENHIHQLIERSSLLQVKANELEDQAQELLAIAMSS